MRLNSVPHTTVTVVATDQTLIEYDDTEDTRLSDNVGVKYIQARSGSDFKVMFTADRDQFGGRGERDVISCDIFLDGMLAESTLLERRALDDSKIYAKLVGKYNDAQNTLERFRFADLETSDESVAGVQNERLKQLGEIKIILKWGLIIEERAEGEEMEFKPAAFGKIPEKCLKGRALSRKAILGEAEPAHAGSRVRLDRPYGRDPFATFIFKYRSRRDLQIEDIIPRDPSPVLKSPAPLEKRDIEKLSLEEAHERLRRQARNEEGLQAKIKREKRDVAHVVEDSSDDDVAITEVSSRNKRQRLSSTVRENVIEVSDDE